MIANMVQARAIASTCVAVVCVAALPLWAQGQTADSARARMVDSALRTYRLLGITGGAGSVAPSSPRYYGWRRAPDGTRTILVPVMPAGPPAMWLECPMPVTPGPGGAASAITGATMDSVASSPPGSPVPMPTRRYPCLNPLRR